MELVEATEFVMSLRGAGVACLVFMYALRDTRRHFTRNDLADFTGYSRPAVATGLRRLEAKGLVFRENYESWQLTDVGYQLSFENLRVKSNDSESHFILLSGGSSGLKNHDMHEQHDSLNHHHLRVKSNDSQQNSDPIFEDLVSSLISAGASPAKARAAIDQAFAGEVSDQDIQRRILWWRAYCVSHNSMKFPGNLIAARVATATDTPADFRLKDIPHQFSELRDELEDFERQYQQSQV